MSTRSVRHFCIPQCQSHWCYFCYGIQIFLRPLEPSWGHCWSQSVSGKCRRFSPRQSCTTPSWHLECFGLLWGPRLASGELLWSSKLILKCKTLCNNLFSTYALWWCLCPRANGLKRQCHFHTCHTWKDWVPGSHGEVKALCIPLLILCAEEG